MAMSEQQKAAMKAGREKAAAEKKAVQELTQEQEQVETVEAVQQSGVSFSKEEVDRMIAEATAKAIQEALDAMPKQSAQPQIIRVSTDAPVVKMRFQCECSPVNVIQFGVNGKFGTITGKSGTFSVPKESFAGEFRDEMVQNLLASRELIVLDGLTDDERDLYGINYAKGEVMDEKTFAKMVDMGAEILDIYDDLCPAYKEAIARRYAEEYEKNPTRIARDITVKLNEKSKVGCESLNADDVRRKGAFYGVIEAMNRKESEV
jgi:hypothetical protein